MREAYELVGLPEVAVVGDPGPVHGVVSELSEDDRLRVSDFDGEASTVDCLLASADELDTVRHVLADNPDLPFVVFGNASTRDEAVEVGALEYVRIPVEDKEMFARRLRRYAEGHRSKLDRQRLDSVFRHSPDQIALHDEDGSIVEVNRRVSEALGYSREELLGMNVSEIEVDIDEDRLESLWSEYEYGEPIRLEGRHRRKDGSEFPVEVNLGKVLYDGEELFLAIARDISERKTAQERIDLLRREHETVFRNVQDPMFLVEERDGGFYFQRLNPAYEEQTGVSEEDARGKTPQKIFGEGIGGDFAENYRRCLETGETLSYEETIEVPAGVRTYHTKLSPVDVDGNRHVVGSARDITERKEREYELERYESYVEGTSDIITHLGEDGTIMFHSTSVQRVLDYDTSEIVGDNVFEYVHPDDRDRVVRRFTSLVNDSKEETETVEFRFRHSDGSYVWLQSIGRDETDTELGGVVVSSRDVTERRKREEKLQRYRQIVESSRDVLWMFSPDFSETLFINSPYEEIFGQSVGELHRETTAFLDMVHPDDRDRLLRRMEEAPEGEVEFEVRANPDEDYGRWVWGKGQPVYEDGEVVGVSGFTRDVTERKRKENQLREQKKLLERRKDQIQFFNSLLRHDMLNSMNVIHGNAEMLVGSLPEGTDDHDSAERILRQSDNVIELTNRVRSVLETVGEETELSEVNLSETVEQRVENLRESYDVEVTSDVPDGVRVTADDLLGDVLENILVNAVEHNDNEEPRVDVTVEEGDETVTVRVADNGPGVSDRLKSRIFREGAKGETSGGTGFGLYFVDSMVREYGGDVSVEDNEPEGAVFVLELPLV